MWFFWPSTDERLDARRKALWIENTQPAPTPVPVEEPSQVTQDYSSANKELAKKLWEKGNGKSLDRFQKGSDIITSDLNARLDKTKYDWAKQSYEAQYGKADDTTVSKWITANQKKIERDMYGSLTQESLKQWVGFDKGSLYTDYISTMMEAPKDTRSLWQKTKNTVKTIGYGIVDTPIGLGAALTDEAFGTNTYKKYFWERTSIKEGNDSFADKTTNLLGEQMAWLDVAFGIGTFFTAGVGAPVFASLSASIKWGGKAIAKSALKGGAEWFIESGLKDVFKASGDDIYQAIIKGNGATSIGELAAKEGMDATAYMWKLRGSLRDAWEKGFTKWSKQYKEYTKAVDHFTDLSGIGVGGTIRKQNRWMDSLSDGLGLPTQFLKLGEAGGKRTYSASFMWAAMNVALPSTTLLPGVGDWFEATGLRLGWALASQYALATRTGMVQSERQTFIDQYGVDPEKAEGPLKAKWEEQLNYKMRHALPSEILTGQTFSERGNGGQLLWGAFDAAANFAGVMAGMHGIGKAYGFSKEQMSPIKMENGEIVSNISFIKELNDIHKSDFDEATKDQKIQELKNKVDAGSPDLKTTIKSSKELKSAILEAQWYYRTVWGEAKDVLRGQWETGMASVLKEMETGNMESAIQKLDGVNKSFSDVASNLISPDAIKRVNDKIDVLDTYFKKVRQDHSFLSNLTKQFAVNAFTTNIKDPTGAIIRWSEELVASAKSIYSELDNMHDIMVSTYKTKGEYIAKRYPHAFEKEHPLDSRIEDMLKTSGIQPSREAVVALRFPIVTALTKTQFEMKEFQDTTLEKTFDTVFSEYGMDLRRTNQEGGKSLGEIMMDLNSSNLDENVKLSSRIEMMMNDKILARKSELQAHQQFLQGNAMQIGHMDRLFSELTTQLHAQRSRDRIGDVEFVRTEETPVREEIDTLEKTIREKEKQNISVESEKADLATLKEIEKDNVEAVVTKDYGTDIDPMSSPMAHKMISDDTVQSAIVKTANETSEKYITEKTRVQERRDTLKNFHDSIMRAHEYAYDGFLKNAKEENDIESMDTVVGKEIDNYYKNEQRIKAYDDMLFRGIAEEYNQNASRFFNREGEVDLESLKKFAQKKTQIMSKEIERIYSEIAIELTKENPSKQKLSSKARQIEEAIRHQTTRNFTRDGIIELARKSDDIYTFEANLRKSIKDNFKFTDEVVQKFMKNQFNDNINNVIPFYELYKKQMKIEAFKIDFESKDGELVPVSTRLSSSSPLDFIDDYGNSSLYRLEGVGTSRLREKYDILSMDDITIDGKRMDSYWVQGKAGNERVDDKKKFWDEQVMGGVIKEMESHGYIFLGDFQEEGKKRMFVKPKTEGATWNDAMMDLTGIDFKQIEAIPNAKVRNQAISNFQKYAKLIWWGEINPNKDLWKAAIVPPVSRDQGMRKLQGLEWAEELINALSMERSDQVRHLIYEDNIADPITGQKEKVSDGRTYNLSHYTATLNKTIGASSKNLIHKTATLAWPGQFIKSQDITASDGNFSDPGVIDAMYKSEDPKIQAIVDFTIKNFGNDWYDNPDAVSRVHNLFYDYRVIDRIIPLSAYKNIFTRKISAEDVPFEFENYKNGQILEAPLENIGLKAIDFYKSPEARKNETIKFSNQVIRNIHEVWQFTSAEANAINDTFNDIRKSDYKDILDLAGEVGTNPNLIISKIEERFGLKFSDFQKNSFISLGSADNLEKFLTNIMKNGVTTGSNLKGNQIDLTYPPSYHKIAETINNKLSPQDKDNWIILSREYFGHLDGDRYMMFRYPVVSDKVINAPKIIWAEDIQAETGIKFDIGSSGAPSLVLIKKIEGDGDGDKIVLVTDERLKPVQHLINKFADEPKWDFEVDNATANAKDEGLSVQDLWYKTAYDTFEGKANIGILDNKITEIEKYIQMGIIKNTWLVDAENPYGKQRPDGSKEWYTGYAHDYLRQVLGVTLQRTVDNKSINLESINKIINESIGIPGKNVAGEHNIDLFFKDKEGKYKSKIIITPDGDKINLANIRLYETSDGAVQILKALAMKAKDWEYKMNEAEYSKYRKMSAKDLQASVNRVQSILKKQNFFDDDKIQKMIDSGADKFQVIDAQKKSVLKIRAEYLEVKKSYDELVQFYGHDIIDRDPQMRFIRDMESQFLRQFPDMKTPLKKTLATALSKVKEKFPDDLDSEISREFRDVLKEYDRESKGYSRDRDASETGKEAYEQQRTKKLGELEDKIYGLVDRYEIKDLDPIIIRNLPATHSKLTSLMSASGRQNLDGMIHGELSWIPLYRLGIYDSSVNIGKMFQNFGNTPKDQYAKVLEDTMGGEVFDKYFSDAQKQMLSDSTVHPVAKDMIQSGIHPEQFREFTDTINNLEPEKKDRVVDRVISINESDLKAVLSVMKETGDMKWAIELLMTAGYKEISKEKLVEKTRDAYTTVKESPFNKPNC